MYVYIYIIIIILSISISSPFGMVLFSGNKNMALAWNCQAELAWCILSNPERSVSVQTVRPSKISKLVQIPPISLWFMVPITIVPGAYKPKLTSLGASHCRISTVQSPIIPIFEDCFRTIYFRMIII